MKSILSLALGLSVALAASSASAALDKSEVLSVLKGAYTINMEGNEVVFLIRSAGKVQVLTHHDDFDVGVDFADLLDNFDPILTRHVPVGND